MRRHLAALVLVATAAMATAGCTAPTPISLDPTDTPSSESTPSEPPAAAMTSPFLDNVIVGAETKIAGVDIQPGTYRSGGVLGHCSWIIANSEGKVIDGGGTSDVDSPMTVTIIEGQKFSSQGCVSWIKH